MLAVREDRPGVVLCLEEESKLGPRRAWLLGLLIWFLLGLASLAVLISSRGPAFPPAPWDSLYCALIATTVIALFLWVWRISVERFPLGVSVDAQVGSIKVATTGCFGRGVKVETFPLSSCRWIVLAEAGDAGRAKRPLVLQLSIDGRLPWSSGGVQIRHIDLQEELVDLAVRIGAIGRFAGVRVWFDGRARLGARVEREADADQVPVQVADGPADYEKGLGLTAGIAEWLAQRREASASSQAVVAPVGNPPNFEGPFRVLEWVPGRRIHLRRDFQWKPLASSVVPLLLLILGGSLFVGYGLIDPSVAKGTFVCGGLWYALAATAICYALTRTVPVAATIDWQKGVLRRERWGMVRSLPLKSIAAVVARRVTEHHSVGKGYRRKSWTTYRCELRIRSSSSSSSILIAETWEYRNDSGPPIAQARLLGVSLAAALGCRLEVED